MRGGFRKAIWNTHPVKTEFMKARRVKAPVGRVTEKWPEGQMIWGAQCATCKETFRQEECQVDHLEGAGSLKTVEDFQRFITKLAFVCFEDLQIVCKECHAIHSYSEKNNLSFEDAKLAKAAIRFLKECTIDEQKEFLIENRVATDQIGNEKGRRAAYIELNSGRDKILFPEVFTW